MNRRTFAIVLKLWPLVVLVLLMAFFAEHSIIPLLLIIPVILLLLAHRYRWTDAVFDRLEAFDRKLYRKPPATVRDYQPPLPTAQRKKRSPATTKEEWNDYERATAQYPEQLPPLQQQ